MRDALDLLFRVCNFIAGVVCLIAAGVSFIKGDVMHVTLAYYAGGYVLLRYAERDE